MRKTRTSGIVMLELLIALAVFALMSAALMALAASTVTAALDLERERAAREAARGLLALARANDDFQSVRSQATGTTSVEVIDISPCLKRATARAAYTTASGVAATESIATFMSDPSESVRRGADCISAAPEDEPSIIVPRAKVTLPATTTALDLLNGAVYVGLKKAPYLAIVGYADGTLRTRTTFSNGFKLPAAPNNIDAVEVRDAHGTEHRYVYAALATSTRQLVVADVTDPARPIVTARISLANVDPQGSEPAGWRVLYYDQRLYVTVRETAGRELHVFDASDPADPTERGSGTELGITVNNLAAGKRRTQQGLRTYLFTATSWVRGEVTVYDVTSDDAREVTSARTALGGNQNAQTIALIGPRLLVGRDSASGPELFTFDASKLPDELPLIDSTETNAGIRFLVPWGNALYALFNRPGTELELWHSAATSSLIDSETLAGATAMDADGSTFAAIAGKTLRFYGIR